MNYQSVLLVKLLCSLKQTRYESNFTNFSKTVFAIYYLQHEHIKIRKQDTTKKLLLGNVFKNSFSENFSVKFHIPFIIHHHERLWFLPIIIPKAFFVCPLY